MHSDVRLTRKVMNSGWTYFGLAAAFFAASIIAFCWSDEVAIFRADRGIDSGRFGNFGDFCAGTLGTIFGLVSILLVLRTLSLQRETSETQRFNDLFFELLRLYQSLASKLHNEKDDLSYFVSPVWNNESLDMPDIGDDKEFFEVEKRRLSDRFVPAQTYNGSNRKAKRDFDEVYHRYETYLAIYFRTLYRIFDLIDSSEISDAEKSKYAKIVRAQLSKGELFFLRYNAFTRQGQKFRNYLFKYNVLKHLPYLDLLEFKPLRKPGLSYRDLEPLSHQLNVFVKTFHQWYGGKKQTRPYTYGLRYRFLLTYHNCKSVEIELLRDDTKPASRSSRLLDDMKDDDMKLLVDSFVREMFVYSNFQLYNRTAKIETAVITLPSGVTLVKSRVTSSDEPLIVKYPFER